MQLLTTQEFVPAASAAVPARQTPRRHISPLRPSVASASSAATEEGDGARPGRKRERVVEDQEREPEEEEDESTLVSPLSASLANENEMEDEVVAVSSSASSSSSSAAAASLGPAQAEVVDVSLMREVYRARAAATAKRAPGGSPFIPGRFSSLFFDRYADSDDITSDEASFAGLFASVSAANVFPAAATSSSPTPSSSSSSSSSSASSSASSFPDVVDAASLGGGAAGTASLAACAEASGDAAAKESVEDTYTRVLNKGHFRKMASRIVGQFNLGFIVAGTGPDLFILDQHACDEKHQYETLRATTTIHEQRLLIPRPIDLTAAEEITILDNLPTFNSNGFHFAVDEQATAGRRVKLAAVPFSKNIQFGDEDVRELASLLAEAGAEGGGGGISAAAGGGGGGAGGARVRVRLPKANAMFASRACRTAVMIGKPLKRDAMRRIVKQLSSLEQPWNCPHGRPTLRHLVDLSSADMRKAGGLRPAGGANAVAAVEWEGPGGEEEQHQQVDGGEE
jgi:DNA mismatch repair ATPase MutL